MKKIPDLALIAVHMNYRFGTNWRCRVAKLEEEVEELKAAIGQGSRDDIADELADCTIVLFHLSTLLGFTREELIAMAWDKIKGREENPNYKRKHPHQGEQ